MESTPRYSGESVARLLNDSKYPRNVIGARLPPMTIPPAIATTTSLGIHGRSRRTCGARRAEFQESDRAQRIGVAAGNGMTVSHAYSVIRSRAEEVGGT